MSLVSAKEAAPENEARIRERRMKEKASDGTRKRLMMMNIIVMRFS